MNTLIDKLRLIQSIIGDVVLELESFRSGDSPAQPESHQLNLEDIYKKYPRKIGKTPGMRKAKQMIKGHSDLIRLDAAVDNFANFHKTKGTEIGFIPYFSTFMNQWEDWVLLEEKVISPNSHRDLAERILTSVGKFGPDRGAEAKQWIGEVGWQAVKRFGGYGGLCSNLTYQNMGLYRDKLEAILKDLLNSPEPDYPQGDGAA